jgi:hypothetical protein
VSESRSTFGRTPLFAGADTTPSHRQEARAKAHELLPAHPDLGYGLLFSAAAYLIRKGEPLRDSAVLAEARRRMRWGNAAVDRRARRFAGKDEAA